MIVASPTKRPVPTGLIDEMRRYLIAVETFRAEGCEPHWLPVGEHETRVDPELEAIGDLISMTDPRRHR